MNIARWCIKNNQTTIILYLVLMILGLATYTRIGRNEFPEIPIRAAQILTTYPGRTALQVEQEVTHQLEQKIREIPEIDEIDSTSKNGLSIITVEVAFQYKGQLDVIWKRLREKIDDAAAYLPVGAGTPVVNDEFGDVFGIVVSLTGDGYTYRELKDFAEEVRHELRLVKDVGKVELFGTQEERIFVEFSNSRLAELAVSPFTLAGLLKAENTITSSGDVKIGPYRSVISTLGEFKSLDDIRMTTLQVPGKAQSFKVKDIANVWRAFVDPPSRLVRFNGKEAISIAVHMSRGGVITELGERITAKIAEIQNRLPWGLELGYSVYQAEYVAKSISDFVVNLGQAFFFVVLVMYLFAGLRIALIVGILVPSAILMCVAMMPAVGVELQTVSIAALIIALGMLVDNAVVVSERILVRLGDGEDRLAATAGAVSELWIPLLAASLTTIFAFLPIATAKSDVGTFCYSLFAVVSLTLGSSWLLSLTIVPLCCYYVLQPLKKETLFGRYLLSSLPYYERFLRFWLKRGLAFPLLIAALTLLAGWGFRFVPKLFFPPNARALFTVELNLPFGTTIETTRTQVARLENFLLGEMAGDIEKVTSFIGSGGPRWYVSLAPEPPNPNYSFMLVLTKSALPPEVERVIGRVRHEIKSNYPDIRGNVRLLETGPAVGTPVQIRLSGKDLGTLYRLRNLIVERVQSVGGVFNVRDNWGAWGAQVTVEQDKVRAGRSGLKTDDIAASLSTQFSGIVATSVLEGTESIPVIIRSQDLYRGDVSRLKSLNIYSTRNETVVPLSQVANVKLTWQPSSVLRRNMLRTMTIEAEVLGRFVSEVLADIQPKIDELMRSSDWVSGYQVEYGGEEEKSTEAQASIMAGMPLAVGLLMLVLVSQFNSVWKLIIIICTIPPMVIGITPGLIITQAPFGFMATLGMVSLMGIIVNNAILLLEQIGIERANGLSVEEAITAAARSRLRPILMTTITTIMGLVPLSLSGGEMWRPMANTMMFGLGFATVLTLVLCPVLYNLFYGRQEGPIVSSGLSSSP